MKIRTSHAHLEQSIEKAKATVRDLVMIQTQVQRITEEVSESRQALILSKYIELQRSDAVAGWLNGEGLRFGETDSGRKYLHTDITDLITSKEKDGAVRFRSLARAIFDYNKGKVGWAALVRAFQNYT